MQSEVGAVRAPVSGGEKVQDIHLVWKTIKNVSGDLGSLFKGVHQSIIGYLALLPMTLGHKINRRFFI